MKTTTSLMYSAVGTAALLFQMASSEPFSYTRILSSDDDFDYSNPNDNYSPNDYVKWGNEMSRADRFEANTDFIKNAAYMPAILAALGILAFLLINLFFLFRCCCNCIKCLPDYKAENYKPKRFRVLLAFYFILFATLAFDQILFLGNAEMDKSVTTMQGSITDVNNLVDSVLADVSDMIDYSGTMISDVSAIAADVEDCVYAQSLDLSDYINTANSSAYAFHDTADQLDSSTDDIDKYMSDAHDYVDKYGNEYRFKVICAIWLVSIIAVLLVAFTHCCRAKCAMQTVLLIVWLVFLLYIVLGALWGIFTTTMGSFCMEPIHTINRLVPDSARDYTLYYTACMGDGPLNKYVDKAVNKVTSLNESLSNITATAQANNFNSNCPGNPLIADIQGLQSTLTSAVNTITDIQDQIGCESIQPIFFDIINKGWCTEMYSGVFYVWGSQLFTNFFLFLSVLVASYVWQYYVHWDGDKGEDFEQVQLDDSGSEGSEDSEADIVVNPERDTFLERETSIAFDSNPYANPNAHAAAPSAPPAGTMVAPAMVVTVVPDEEAGAVEMTTNPKRSSKKGPKKMKASTGGAQTDYSEIERDGSIRL